MSSMRLTKREKKSAKRERVRELKARAAANVEFAKAYDSLADNEFQGRFLRPLALSAWAKKDITPLDASAGKAYMDTALKDVEQAIKQVQASGKTVTSVVWPKPLLVHGSFDSLRDDIAAAAGLPVSILFGSMNGRLRSSEANWTVMDRAHWRQPTQLEIDWLTKEERAREEEKEASIRAAYGGGKTFTVEHVSDDGQQMDVYKGVRIATKDFVMNIPTLNIPAGVSFPRVGGV